MKIACNPRGTLDVVMYSALNHCLITLTVLQGKEMLKECA